MSHEQDIPDYDAIDPDMVLHQFECDAGACPATHEGNGSFRSVWDEAKAAGWRARMVDSEWKHFCPKHARS